MQKWRVRSGKECRGVHVKEELADSAFCYAAVVRATRWRESTVRISSLALTIQLGPFDIKALPKMPRAVFKWHQTTAVLCLLQTNGVLSYLLSLLFVELKHHWVTNEWLSTIQNKTFLWTLVSFMSDPVSFLSFTYPWSIDSIYLKLFSPAMGS